MLSVLAQSLVATAIISYPEFGDRGLIRPPAIERSPHVEAATDLGPIIEIIVRCPHGTAILTYSKVDKRYCTPKLRCGRSLAAIVARSCG